MTELGLQVYSPFYNSPHNMMYGVIFMSLFFGTLFILFMFIGVVFSVYAVFYFLLKPKKRREIVLLPLDENCGDVRGQLSFLFFESSLFTGEMKAVVVDMGMNNIQREICEKICEENGVKLIYPEKITEVL